MSPCKSKIVCFKSFGILWDNSYTFTFEEVTLHFWRSSLAQKRNKWQKDDVTDCLKIYHLHFTSSILMQISGNSHFLAQTNLLKKPTNCISSFTNIIFWPNANMKISVYRKRFNLKVFRNSFCLCFHYKLGKNFEVAENVKKSRFEGDWDKWSAKIWFHRKSTTKYKAKSEKIKQNWIRSQIFDTCFCVSFDSSCQNFFSEWEAWH